MATSAICPVTVTPEAAAQIARLRIQSEVDQMIERACSVLPDLENIQVNLYERHELGVGPGISVDLYSRRPYQRHNPEERELIRWAIREFPSQVPQQVIIDYHPAETHAG